MGGGGPAVPVGSPWAISASLQRTGFLRGVAAVVLCLAIAAPAFPASATPETINLSADAQAHTVDLGEVRRGMQLERRVPLRNSLAFPATIRDVQSSCSCTVAKDIEGATLKPGELLPLPLSIDLANKTGEFRQSVHLTFAPPLGELALTVRGTVVEEYPAELRFEDLRAAETRRERFLLRTWPGQPPVRVLKAEHAMSGVVVSIEEVDAQTVAVEVKVTAGARGDTLEGTISLNTNDSEVPDKVMRVYASVLDSLVPSREKLVFGAVKPGTSETLSMTVTTPYDEAIPVFQLAQKNADQFAVVLKPEPGKCTLTATVRAKDDDTGILRDVIELVSADGYRLEIPAFALVR